MSLAFQADDRVDRGFVRMEVQLHPSSGVAHVLGTVLCNPADLPVMQSDPKIEKELQWLVRNVER